MNEVAFKDLSDAELVIDTIYKGGTQGNMGDEVLSKLLPKCGNAGGFRKIMRQDSSGLPAYVVLYTSMRELAGQIILKLKLEFFGIMVIIEILATIFSILMPAEIDCWSGSLNV